MRFLSLLCTFFFLTSVTADAEMITVAAAADLKFAMDEVVRDFQKLRPEDKVQVIYGSSGKFHTQIRQGAPYDLFFSADIQYPRELAREGLAASAVKAYATGRLVLWSSGANAEKMTLAELLKSNIKRVAIANPQHAPYGKRAEEVLRSSGLWEKLQQKLIYGENIAQTTQYVQSGNAQAGIIALSMALSPSLARKGHYRLIPQNLHYPLEQGYIMTKSGVGKPLAKVFLEYFSSKPARNVLLRYGFSLPAERSGG